MRCETKNAAHRSAVPPTPQVARGLFDAPMEARAYCGESGLVAGTMVLSLDGELPVERLVSGDLLITRMRGAAMITGMVCRTVKARVLRIAADSLGPQRPSREAHLVAGQTLIARHAGSDQTALRPAQALAGLRGVEDLGLREVSLHQPLFAQPQVLYCDGLEVLVGSGISRAVRTFGS